MKIAFECDCFLFQLSYFATSPLLMTLFSCPLLAFLLWRLTPMKILILGLMAVVIVSVVCEYVHQYQVGL